MNFTSEPMEEDFINSIQRHWQLLVFNLLKVTGHFRTIIFLIWWKTRKSVFGFVHLQVYIAMIDREICWSIILMKILLYRVILCSIYFLILVGRLWICTNNGLAIWEPSGKRIRTDVFPEGFIHKQRISSVYEDSGHQLYFIPDKGNYLYLIYK